MKLKKISKTTAVLAARKEYLSAQRPLFNNLAAIKENVVLCPGPHPYTPDDWTRSSDGKCSIKKQPSPLQRLVV